MPEMKVETTPAETEIQEADAFATLILKEHKPTRARDDIENALKKLVEWALDQTTLVSDDAIKSIKSIIAAIDKRLTEQVNLILHHEDFQKLEGSWRGLSYLVKNTETEEKLKIKVLNITKKEVNKMFQQNEGAAWDQSPLFKKIYTNEYSMFGGEPFGCMIGDYEFDHLPPDIEFLEGIAKIASAAHMPFIAATSPQLLDMKSWQELPNPRDLTKMLGTPEHASWNEFRKSEDARYVGLTMPRFLSRLPYGPKTLPVDEFVFEEDIPSAKHNCYTWSNSAYAMGVNINRAFKENGWCTQIRGVSSGGIVERLPTHTFPTDDGGVDMKCPTEIAIDDRREKELADNGFMPILHKKNSNYAAFIGAQSLQKPFEYDDANATANANLSARLPYMFAVCRFAHYLKCIVRDKIGSFKERDDMQKWLTKWINNYVEPNPETASDNDKARKPLAAAEVIIEDVEGDPGYYTAKFKLRPHYQLEGLTVSLSLVSKLEKK